MEASQLDRKKRDITHHNSPRRRWRPDAF